MNSNIRRRHVSRHCNSARIQTSIVIYVCFCVIS